MPKLDYLFEKPCISHVLDPRKRSNSRSSTRKSLYLWEFLFGLLEDDECASVITWTNKREGIFELRNTEELAKLWGTVKNRPRMDKSKLIRAIRTYYERGMLKKVIQAAQKGYPTLTCHCSVITRCIRI